MMQGKLHHLLTELGLIFAPATLVGLIGAIADLSGRSTAVLSVCTAAIIALLHYRHIVDAKVSSAFCSALMIIGAVGCYFFYENALQKDTGLVLVSKKSNDYLGELGKLISQSKEEIIFFGFDFHITVEDKREQLIKKLNEGVNIKFLVINPFSKNIELLASDFDIDLTKLKSDSANGLQGMLALKKRWAEVGPNSPNPGSLEVRFFNTTPRMRAYFFDGATGTGHAYIVPYMNKINSPQSPGYLFSVKKDGISEIYLTGMRKLWNESIVLDDKFLRDNVP